jgi:hypothetical protein
MLIADGDLLGRDSGPGIEARHTYACANAVLLLLARNMLN